MEGWSRLSAIDGSSLVRKVTAKDGARSPGLADDRCPISARRRDVVKAGRLGRASAGGPGDGPTASPGAWPAALTPRVAPAHGKAVMPSRDRTGPQPLRDGGSDARPSRPVSPPLDDALAA